MSRPSTAGSDDSKKSTGSNQTTGSKKSTGSNQTTGSNDSTESYGSVLSDDSYLGKLLPGKDDDFQALLNTIKALDTERSLAKERKIQSHEAKKRDPTDTDRRTDWTPQMEREHAAYKAKVETIKAARIVALAAGTRAKESKATIEERIKLREGAMKLDDSWIHEAIAN
ncbi:hypothetical protein C8A00DRAFT_36923 [Chaetomidium leptoderma]|uniref:Uncharacterized protein n=1 Tax=Chaetomidium leptoderma TaxID=669021 RepID=A0AAN6ZTM5_9PEZI|nr:hypothetical protein C8A00DRAFT_36923 [Chaetomidium leptoderma]